LKDNLIFTPPPIDTAIAPRSPAARARRLACALAAALIALCQPAAAQSVERIEMPGGSINLVVPAGQCSIARDTEGGRRMIAQVQRTQTTRILLLYTGCDDARRIAGVWSAFEMKGYGVYSVPQREGVPFKESKSATREELIAGYAQVFPALDSALIERLAQPRARAEGAASKLVMGTLERDANALYLGVSASVSAAQAATPDERKWAVAALTLIGGYMISHTAYGDPAPGAPFAALLARQQRIAGLLVEANK
jgi:hypothetical protein